jgi:predicted RNase H-like HicB family nuclease
MDELLTGLERRLKDTAKKARLTPLETLLNRDWTENKTQMHDLLKKKLEERDFTFAIHLLGLKKGDGAFEEIVQMEAHKHSPIEEPLDPELERSMKDWRTQGLDEKEQRRTFTRLAPLFRSGLIQGAVYEALQARGCKNLNDMEGVLSAVRAKPEELIRLAKDAIAGVRRSLPDEDLSLPRLEKQRKEAAALEMSLSQYRDFKKDWADLKGKGVEDALAQYLHALSPTRIASELSKNIAKKKTMDRIVEKESQALKNKREAELISIVTMLFYPGFSYTGKEFRSGELKKLEPVYDLLTHLGRKKGFLKKLKSITTNSSSTTMITELTSLGYTESRYDYGSKIARNAWMNNYLIPTEIKKLFKSYLASRILNPKPGSIFEDGVITSHVLVQAYLGSGGEYRDYFFNIIEKIASLKPGFLNGDDLQAVREVHDYAQDGKNVWQWLGSESVKPELKAAIIYGFEENEKVPFKEGSYLPRSQSNRVPMLAAEKFGILMYHWGKKPKLSH